MTSWDVVKVTGGDYVVKCIGGVLFTLEALVVPLPYIPVVLFK
jgi:hypothetical protein